jgi:hypothetical protein
MWEITLFSADFSGKKFSIQINIKHNLRKIKYIYVFSGCVINKLQVCYTTANKCLEEITGFLMHI